MSRSTGQLEAIQSRGGSSRDQPASQPGPCIAPTRPTRKLSMRPPRLASPPRLGGPRSFSLTHLLTHSLTQSTQLVSQSVLVSRLECTDSSLIERGRGTRSLALSLSKHTRAARTWELLLLLLPVSTPSRMSFRGLPPRLPFAVLPFLALAC